LLTLNKTSILIIDDDQTILRAFRRIFQRRGYTVTVAAKGSEAIEQICSKHFDVALIDFCLPDMEGSELFSLIQQSSASTVKVMLTGKQLPDNCSDGADVLLGKPIQPDKLLDIIETKLKNRNIE